MVLPPPRARQRTDKWAWVTCREGRYVMTVQNNNNSNSSNTTEMVLRSHTAHNLFSNKDNRFFLSLVNVFWFALQFCSFSQNIFRLKLQPYYVNARVRLLSVKFCLYCGNSHTLSPATLSLYLTHTHTHAHAQLRKFDLTLYPRTHRPPHSN